MLQVDGVLLDEVLGGDHSQVFVKIELAAIEKQWVVVLEGLLNHALEMFVTEFVLRQLNVVLVVVIEVVLVISQILVVVSAIRVFVTILVLVMTSLLLFLLFALLLLLLLFLVLVLVIVVLLISCIFVFGLLESSG